MTEAPDTLELLAQAHDLRLDQDTTARAQWLEHSSAPAERRRRVAEILARGRQDGSDDILELPLQRVVGEWVRDELPPGAVLGPYTIEARAGVGGTAVVYRARDPEGELAALKVFHRREFAGGRGGRGDREVAMLSMLNELRHPNIAGLRGHGADAEVGDWIATEYVDGVALDRYCDEAGLGLRDRVRLLIEVAEAVQFAHQHLVVHRDLKPANILVDRDGRPRLVDFGIANRVADANATTTVFGLRAMTPAYASPEQISGAPLTTATDVYSLGVVAFELLAGARPYRVDASDPRAMRRAIWEEEPERLSRAAREQGRPAAWCRQLAGDLEAIVEYALRKAPGARYGSAAALASELDAFLNGRPVRARRQVAVLRAIKFARRHRAPLALVGGLAVALVGITVQRTTAAHAIAAERDHAEALAVSRLAEREAAEHTVVMLHGVATAGDREAGLAQARRAAQQAPALSAASMWASLGYLYLDALRFEDAVAAFSAGLERVEELGAHARDRRVDLRRGLGFALLMRQEPAAAEPVLRETVRAETELLGAEHFATLATRARWVGTLVSLARLDEAETELEVLARLAPIPSQQASALLLRGRIAAARGQHAQAIDSFLEGLDLPDAATASLWTRIAVSWAELGRHAEALDAANLAVEAAQSGDRFALPWALVEQARAHWRQGAAGAAEHSARAAHEAARDLDAGHPERRDADAAYAALRHAMLSGRGDAQI